MRLTKRNLQGLGRTGDLEIQGYPYSLALYQLSYPEILLNRLYEIPQDLLQNRAVQ